MSWEGRVKNVISLMMTQENTVGVVLYMASAACDTMYGITENLLARELRGWLPLSESDCSEVSCTGGTPKDLGPKTRSRVHIQAAIPGETYVSNA